MKKLDRFEIENASRQVAEYFYRLPHEATLSKDEETFNRAKKETLAVIADALQKVENLEFSDFQDQLKRCKLMQRVERTSFWPWANHQENKIGQA